MAVLIWVISIKTYADLKKKKLILGKQENFINDYGLFPFICNFILLAIHPISFSIDVKFFIEEAYYK